MSPVSMPTPTQSPEFSTFLEALRVAPTAPDAKAAADRLAHQVAKTGLASLKDGGIIDTLTAFAANKKSGYERESAAVGFQSLATVIGPPAAPILLPSLPTLFELYADKGDVVREAAVAAVKSIIKLFPPESTRILFNALEGILEKAKWQVKVGVLDAMRLFVGGAKDEVAEELGTVLPKIELTMHDTKKEVSSAAIKCGTTLCGTMPNPDLVPHIPALVKCMSNPDTVPQCIKAMSNTTFVSEVTSPSLAVLVPLLLRALNDRSMEVQRRTVVVIDNLVKLVRDPKVAARYLSPLVPGVDKIMTSASFPEVRAFAASAHATLLKAGASKDATPPPPRDTVAETSAAVTQLLTVLPRELLVESPNALFKIPPQPYHSLLSQSLSFVGALVADQVYNRRFTNVAVWDRIVGTILKPWLPEGYESSKLASDARSHFQALDRAKYAPAKKVDDSEGEVLCDTLFSLAYGALLLLSHTTLRLIRGKRYGVLAPNGSGKSTLLRAIRDGKVENFPPQEELKAVMVEHALQGEDTSLSVIDFIAADKQLAGTARETIKEQLLEVGFDEARQQDVVGGLSGGWKMKLELARAMLYHADLLLLDEPTNHLDVISVKWLEEYLISRKNVTCLIVSHDSSFLDNVTTDIIHYEAKKLVYYPGNLSAFVELHPEAKSYYSLSHSTVQFSFPPPGSLMGVRSNTRAILKMANCTFTYPGRTEPSLINVSCALSLSSRVGIVGPNGAGKSTLIKLLTGETSPQEGVVYKHPSLRIGYVSQHATHHIERHLEKTAVQYVQWRYQDGHDREVLEKATRVLTDEEKALLETEFVGKNGERRKVELIMGRQKLKKSLQYEIKWRGLDHKFNTWVPREELLAKGFTKLVQQFDDLEASREGAGSRETSLQNVRKHLEDVGLDGDIAQYNEMNGLSGGQRMKVVVASALWNNPQICVLDEPTNFLDRDTVAGLATAIRNWAGAVVIISHNREFVSALCPEIWNIENGRMTHKGKTAVIEDAFADLKSAKSSRPGTPALSRTRTPAASASGTPAASGAEEKVASGAATPLKKKKKLTRNQLKAQEERRRLRKLNWLTFGGPKPDSDSEVEV